ncbi:VOC family protein [soil metagenome]
MIDHIGIGVSDFARSVAFYRQALAPIGYQVLMEFGEAAGFGEPPKPDFWVAAGPPAPQHVAFRVRSRAEVDAFHAAGLAAGGKDNGAPGLRPHYHASYYAAFVIDLEGHNIEAVCHSPE